MLTEFSYDFFILFLKYVFYFVYILCLVGNDEIKLWNQSYDNNVLCKMWYDDDDDGDDDGDDDMNNMMHHSVVMTMITMMIYAVHGAVCLWLWSP